MFIGIFGLASVLTALSCVVAPVSCHYVSYRYNCKDRDAGLDQSDSNYDVKTTDDDEDVFDDR